MTAKLTPTMIATILKMSATEWRSSYDLKANIKTLDALMDRCLVSSRGGLGSMAFPHTSIKWRLTEEGLEVKNKLVDGQV